MQDSLTSSFRSGETFDTAPPSGSPEEKRVLRVKFKKESLRSGSAPAARGGSPHPDERFTRREVDRACETRKKLRFLFAYELRKQRVTRLALTGMDDNGRTDGLSLSRVPMPCAHAVRYSFHRASREMCGVEVSVLACASLKKS